MIGVIAGDVIESVHEHALTKSTDFVLFDAHGSFATLRRTEAHS